MEHGAGGRRNPVYVVCSFHDGTIYNLVYLIQFEFQNV